MTETKNNNSLLSQFGEHLLDRGYPIVPILPGFKYPMGLKGWETIEATPLHLRSWLSSDFAKGGVGIQTKHFPAVDLDIRDPDVIKTIVAWCEEHIGPTLQRVGDAPKTLLVYRAKTPFPKLSSRKYEDMFGMEHQIEILGDGQQFVAFAIHPDTNKPYEWVSEQSIADILPEELPEISEAQAKELIAYFEENVPEDWQVVSRGRQSKALLDLDPIERVLHNAKPKVQVSNERLIKALNHIDPNDYDTWYRCGMALYHQFDGSFEGFEIWDNWSRAGDTYNADEMEGKWQTYKEDLTRVEPITAATILREARIEKEKNSDDQLEDFLERYIYIEEGDRVCNLDKPPHCCVSKLMEFKNRTANIRIGIPAPTKTDPDKKQLVPIHKTWFVHEERKSAEGLVYLPGEGRIYHDEYGLDWVNEFHVPEFYDTQSESNLSVFFEHMNYLFPIEEEREWFISWLAFNIQRPEERCKVVPLHISPAHGTGRGWVVELLGKLLGQWNITKTKMHILAGEGGAGAYNDYFDRSLVCAIEEVKESGKRFTVSDKIRDLITEKHLEVNKKYGTKKTQAVFTNFFFMSNHTDALVIPVRDRRINVFTGPEFPKPPKYYDRLYEWLKSEGVAQLYNYLMRRNLSGFDWKHSMKTQGRERMILENRTETESLFWDFLNEPPYPAMTFQQIANHLRKISEVGFMDADVDEKQLLKLLQSNSRQVGQVKVKNKTPRPWVFDPEIAKNNEEIRASILECGDFA
ncbi:PriCT-2 domain-containing protein [Algicola sagamiensis]|uniref:PriCT-2 domain-containing protein n=1 Tax=Algicola sagamiensis TaxID=163869 RepID=UPI00037DB6DF|nr:PriCT-2 domain-containing protein [Algicola sagamiensis]